MYDDIYIFFFFFSFPGVKKDISAFAAGGAAPAKADKAGGDDDDLDLFGSDEEVILEN